MDLPMTLQAKKPSKACVKIVEWAITVSPTPPSGCPRDLGAWIKTVAPIIAKRLIGEGWKPPKP